jgi:hypothetical protein
MGTGAHPGPIGFHNGNEGCLQRQSMPRAGLRSLCACGSLAGGPTSTKSYRTVRYDKIIRFKHSDLIERAKPIVQYLDGDIHGVGTRPNGALPN